jgi:quercetin dioxygenase-like cupin family protein
VTRTLKTYKNAEIKKFDKRPGLVGTFVHGAGVTLAHWTFAKGAILASHSHYHEQITYVVSGKVRFEAGGRTEVVEAGGFAVFAPDETHGGTALEDSIALDAFSPAREDFKAEMGWTD